jgi:CheY-like chemotaxis protein
VDGLTRLNVLVVDNNRWTRNNLASALDAGGVCVAEASNGFTAMRKALADAPHVVILGSDLPELSTHELMLGLRTDARTHHTAIVGVQGVVEADASLRIPCNSVEVLATLAEALEVRRQAVAAAPMRSVMASPVGTWPSVGGVAPRSTSRTGSGRRSGNWRRGSGIEAL